MTLNTILGQDRCITLLTRAISSGKTAHAYLFEGIEGCGRTKTALALIQAIFCDQPEACGTCPTCRKVLSLQHPDLHIIEPDGAFIKIDQIRELQRELSLRPFQARRKACIIKNADRLHAAAANALLKTLEEPPGEALIILVTTNKSAVLPTINSRCQVVSFTPLSVDILEQILEQQGNDQETAAVAAALADGSASRAMKIATEEVITERQSIIPAICSLSRSEIGRLFKAAEEYAADRGKAAEILELIVSFLRDVLLIRHGGSDIVNRDMEPLARQEAGRFTTDELLQRIEWATDALRTIRRNANARLALDVLFLRLAAH